MSVAAEELQARRAAAMPSSLRGQIVWLASHVGLPLLVVLIYTNISDVLIRNFGVPSALQPLIGLLAIAVLFCWNVFRPDTIVTQPLTVGLVAYCLLVFASGNWARDMRIVDAELSDLVKSLAMVVIPASLIISWKTLRGALIAVVGAALFLSLLTLLQLAIGNPDLQLGGLAELEPGHVFGDVDTPRPAGPVGDTNYFARILVLAAPLGLFLGAGVRSSKVRAASMVVAAVITLAILLTYSRGAMLALGVTGLLVLLSGRIKLSPATAIAGLLILVALIPTPIGQRMATLGSLLGDDTELDHSTDKRRQLLEVGWRMFTDHPFLGVGAGNFGTHYLRYANDVGWTGRDYVATGLRQYPHNQYLEIAVETGIVGLLVFLATMLFAFFALHRSREILLGRGEEGNAALVTAIAIAISGYLVASVFLHTGYHRYLWLFLGFAAGAVRLANGYRGEAEEVG